MLQAYGPWKKVRLDIVSLAQLRTNGSCVKSWIGFRASQELYKSVRDVHGRCEDMVQVDNADRAFTARIFSPLKPFLNWAPCGCHPRVGLPRHVLTASNASLKACLLPKVRSVSTSTCSPLLS